MKGNLFTVLLFVPSCSSFLLDSEFKAFLSNFTLLQQQVMHNEAAYKMLEIKYQILEEKYQNLSQGISMQPLGASNIPTNMLNEKFQTIADDIKTLNKTMWANQAEIAGLKQKQAYQSAFTAWHPRAGPNSGSIAFNTVLSNIGKDYNSSSGVFTCEYEGVYMFTLHLYKYPSAVYDFVRCYIQRNGTNEIVAFNNPHHQSDTGLYEASNSVTFHLAKGDTVSVGGCTPSNTFFEYSSFSGFLVRAD